MTDRLRALILKWRAAAEQARHTARVVDEPTAAEWERGYAHGLEQAADELED